jgi:hypothetical protein
MHVPFPNYYNIPFSNAVTAINMCSAVPLLSAFIYVTPDLSLVNRLVLAITIHAGVLFPPQAVISLCYRLI